MGIATDLVYIVLAGLVGGSIALLLRQPLLIGYMLAGVVIGPYTGGPTVQHLHDLEMLAEVGVALLLFTLGLEFSIGELTRLARVTFVATPVQMLVCGVAAYHLARGAGFGPSDATWAGAVVSVSSTMVVLKTLAAGDALGTPAGRVMLAVLIAQDLLVVPTMLVLPGLAGDRAEYRALATAAATSALFLTGTYLAGTRLLPRLFSQVARAGSRELFLLTTLAVALGAGYVSHELGLSFALGAFVAGMVLSETDFNHQVLSDVSGLRDLFGLLFFVSVGMLFDPAFFVSHFGTVAAAAAAVIALKTAVFFAVTRALRTGGSSLAIGLGLSQVGEFGFVVANAGKRAGQLSAEAYSLVIAVAVVSMVMTPALFAAGAFVSRKRRGTDADPEWEKDDVGADGHVIVIGGGTVGRYVAQVLGELGKPYVVVELDHRTVMRMRNLGMNVVFGDGTHRTILEAAGAARAELVVVAATGAGAVVQVLRAVRACGSDVPVVVRAGEIEDIKSIPVDEVHEIVQDQLEVGAEMVRQSLTALGTPPEETARVLDRLRSKRTEVERFGGG